MSIMQLGVRFQQINGCLKVLYLESQPMWTKFFASYEQLKKGKIAGKKIRKKSGLLPNQGGVSEGI